MSSTLNIAVMTWCARFMRPELKHRIVMRSRTHGAAPFPAYYSFSNTVARSLSGSDFRGRYSRVTSDSSCSDSIDL